MKSAWKRGYLEKVSHFLNSSERNKKAMQMPVFLFIFPSQKENSNVFYPTSLEQLKITHFSSD